MLIRIRTLSCRWTPLWVALVFTAPVPADELGPIRETVTTLAEKAMATDSIPGLSLALVDDRGVLWSAGFGFADVTAGLPARAETVYAAGSLSTLLTAAAAMQLAEQGVLDLDRPLAAQLPEFSMRSRFGTAAPITPRNLLSHHSGLPAMHFKGMWTRTPLSLADLVAALRDEYVAYPPDYVFDPSEPGYAVLGRLIEVRTGHDFAQHMRERLLSPLGMAQSSYAPSTIDPARRAKGYWHGKIEAPTFPLRDAPAVGLYTNVLDLSQFVRLVLNGGELDGRRLLRPASVAEMLRPQNTGVALDLDSGAGLGWRLSGIRLERASRVAWQTSAGPIGRGRILLAPEQKLGVIVLANSSTGARTIELVSETLLELGLQQRWPDAGPRPPSSTVALPVSEMRDFSGRYASILGMISVSASGDNVRAELLGKTLRLEREPDGLFGVEYRLFGLIPVPINLLNAVRLQPANIFGRQFMLSHYKDHIYRLAEKIPPTPLTPAWRARLGEYQVTDVDPLLELIELRPLKLHHDNDVLYFSYRLPGWMGLTATAPVLPLSDSELVLAGTGWLMGETIRVVRRDGEERLRYSGFELRRIGD
jgi:CubicO group peptidase (beta-lactamase class C family)